MTVRNLIVSFLISLTLISSADARPWYWPHFQNRNIVNPYLSEERASKEFPTRFHNQLVLWKGTVSEQKFDGKYYHLTVTSPHLTMKVQYSSATRNLDVDRKGYTVGVKGFLNKKVDNTVYLDGQSLILLGPPKPFKVKSHQDFLAHWILMHNPNLPQEKARLWSQEIFKQAAKNRIPVYYFAGLLQVESAWDADAVSSSGAYGLGQLMPGTAAGLGVNPKIPTDNIRGSAKMVGNLLHEWRHTADKGRSITLASYNAGPNLLRRRGGKIPSYSQTNNYLYFIGTVEQALLNESAKSGLKKPQGY